MLNTAKQWLERIHALPHQKDKVKIMNVCGGHERSITMAGLRRALPDYIELVPGPGCPVCICPEEDIFEAIQLALNEETVEAKVAEAVKVEKERAAQILGLTKNEAYSGFGELAAECVEKGDSFEVAEGKFKDSRIKVLEDTAPKTPGPGDENAGGDKDKTHLDKAKEYAAENKCSLADALSATAEKRKR